MKVSNREDTNKTSKFTDIPLLKLTIARLKISDFSQQLNIIQIILLLLFIDSDLTQQ